MARPTRLEPATLQADLQRVEARLREAVVTDDDFLTGVASHLILAGGKRARPSFALAAASSARAEHGTVSDDVVMGAVSVELVHLGSLYHDDVIDDAATRRTVESVNARWGNLTAILAGDFLLARASEIAASLGAEVAGLLAATISRLCEGEVRELRALFDTSRTRDAYLASIEGKTASLFSTASRIGGLVAGLPAAHVEALASFGRHFGMAFQIVDDILDVTASEEDLGKPAGHDLVEGVYTLPVLYALADSHNADLRDLLGRPLSPPELDKALAVVRSDAGVGAAQADAERFVGDAIAALAPLGDTEAKAWMTATAERLLQPMPAA